MNFKKKYDGTVSIGLIWLSNVMDKLCSLATTTIILWGTQHAEKFFATGGSVVFFKRISLRRVSSSSFNILSDDKFKDSSKTIPPHSAI